MKRGKFFVIEGIDGSGKSYQTKEFATRLRSIGVDVIATEEPWLEDNIGAMINKALYDKREQLDVRTLQLLYIANRSNHLHRLIEPAILSGKTVVSSRYWMSTAVYGGAFSHDPYFDMKHFIRINEPFVKPDAVFYISVKPEEAYRRLARQRHLTDRFEKLELIKTQSEGYAELEKIYRYKGVWININGNQEKGKVTDEIMRNYGRIENYIV